MSIALENRLFHQFKQNDYILFNVADVFVGVLGKQANEVELLSYQRFKQSWRWLKPDPYLVKGGTFRLRRYAVLQWQNATLTQVTPEAHFQSKEYNSVYGGIDRIFTPMTSAVLQSTLLKQLIKQNIVLFDDKAAFAWRVQCHQFRINASLAEEGEPTPEGIHRDGADYIFIMLLDRQGITGGVSELFDDDKKQIATTALWHNVTNIEPAKGLEKGHRDVLVLTFHRL